ncbi:hypothetical protein C1I98_02895 [Spongiactinospora gelatinilytica]|uniref:HTH cro/C1-type domain-containing protein n=1 Tax=Spongiactinospora gelatinilytica TaxID=2666298 RepID=A0A2W2H702_9ACTN|nr:helix-turn-helix transcriptional regulator [Spongiactinospora gelatinilytica]PZG55653.1 hypothetical protein C1I98_02895 [Spongiactinospora gelatinilytica]
MGNAPSGPGPLGVWLRDELTRRGYDLARGGQSRIAREAGIHPSVISRVLNEERGLEIEPLRRLGQALGLPLGEMLVAAGVAAPDELPVRAHHGPLPPAETDPPRYTDPVLQYLWDTPDPGLTEEQRLALVQMYRALRQSADGYR